LLFGTSFDKATESLFKDPSIDEKAIFDESFTNQEINGKKVHIPDSLLVVYASSDYDEDLLKEEDIDFLNIKRMELVPDMSDTLSAVKQCATYKKQRAFRHMSDNEMRYLNIANFLSLRRKGHLMLDAARKQVLPHLTKVISTQAKIELANGDSTLLGYADLVAHWDDDLEPTVFDVKTSSIAYEEDSVKTSSQLCIYGHALGIKKAGYLVFRKGILKNKVKKCSKCKYDGSSARHKTCPNEIGSVRCNGEWVETFDPQVEVQIIRDNIPAQLENIVLDNIDMIDKAITAKVFVRNFESCIRPWGKCSFYNACYSNDFSDLDKEEKK
jgi:uncharacterized protein YciW